MPNMRSAAKRMRSNLKKQHLNQSALSELKTLYVKLTEQVKVDPAKAKECAQHLCSKLDKAVSRGIIPHGRADRKKARIGRLVQKV